jgi:hypothetical protein
VWATSVISKKLQKVNNKKFAQSGHPDRKPAFLFPVKMGLFNVFSIYALINPQLILVQFATKKQAWVQFAMTWHLM